MWVFWESRWCHAKWSISKRAWTRLAREAWPRRNWPRRFDLACCPSASIGERTGSRTKKLGFETTFCESRFIHFFNDYYFRFKIKIKIKLYKDGWYQKVDEEFADLFYFVGNYCIAVTFVAVKHRSFYFFNVGKFIMDWLVKISSLFHYADIESLVARYYSRIQYKAHVKP